VGIKEPTRPKSPNMGQGPPVLSSGWHWHHQLGPSSGSSPRGSIASRPRGNEAVFLLPVQQRRATENWPTVGGHPSCARCQRCARPACGQPPCSATATAERGTGVSDRRSADRVSSLPLPACTFVFYRRQGHLKGLSQLLLKKKASQYLNCIRAALPSYLTTTL
jgi:hypothetical protein